jgi:hypothetical protein
MSRRTASANAVAVVAANVDPRAAAQAVGDGGCLIDVDLHQLDPSCVRTRQTLERRALHPADP